MIQKPTEYWQIGAAYRAFRIGAKQLGYALSAESNRGETLVEYWQRGDEIGIYTVLTPCDDVPITAWRVVPIETYHAALATLDGVNR